MLWWYAQKKCWSQVRLLVRGQSTIHILELWSIKEDANIVKFQIVVEKSQPLFWTADGRNLSFINFDLKKTKRYNKFCQCIISLFWIIPNYSLLRSTHSTKIIPSTLQPATPPRVETTHLFPFRSVPSLTRLLHRFGVRSDSRPWSRWRGIRQ